MTEILFTSVACLVFIISTYLTYSYLIIRQREEKSLRSYLKAGYDKKQFIFSVVILAISIFIYLYSFYLMKESFLRSLLNGETALWLITLGYIDLKEKIIPNKLIVSGIVFWMILSMLEIFIAHTSWKQLMLFSLTGGGVCGGVLFVIALILRSALGMGDVKMFFVLGLLYGLENTYSILLFSIIIMAVISIILLAAKKVTRKTAVPMAPFVALGFLVCILLGM